MAPYSQVGKYILKRKIGEGAFAEVRLAVHQDTKEEFAVKVFDRDALPKVHFERDIKKEIRIMQHLRHPNIVSIHAVLVTDKKLYLVMELVRGGELYDEIVSKRKVDEPTSRRYFQQIVDAMVYCHRRGVVHRDLKPENLLLDGNGNVKITDFGMSWMKDNFNPALKAKQLLRTQCGTPKYMAPEIIVRPPEGYDGEKLDAWECGMVLYALLAGYLPFSGEDDNTVFKSILNGKLKYPSHFSPGAKDLLSRLLEKDPARRSSLSEIREHFWFLVNYKGDAVKARNTISKPIHSAIRDDERRLSNKMDDAEKENQDPRQNNREKETRTAEKTDSRESKVLSQVTGRGVKVSAGVVTYHVGSSQAVHSSKGQPSLHTRNSGSAALRELGPESSPKSLDRDAPLPETTVIKLPSQSDQEFALGQPGKITTPVNPTFHGRKGKGNGDQAPDMHADIQRNTEMRNNISTNKPARAPGAELQELVPSSPRIKPPRNSPRNVRGKADMDTAKRTPKKIPPLSNKLSSVVKTASSGGETGEDEEAPLSFRDRLRSPLASVLRTLRSGAGSADTETGEDSIKSSWFEISPSSVADLAKRTSNATYQNKQPRTPKGMSSSDEDLGLHPREAVARVELPISPSAFKKMTKVFQKKS